MKQELKLAANRGLIMLMFLSCLFWGKIQYVEAWLGFMLPRDKMEKWSRHGIVSSFSIWNTCKSVKFIIAVCESASTAVWNLTSGDTGLMWLQCSFHTLTSTDNPERSEATSREPRSFKMLFFIPHVWLSCCNANFKKCSQACPSCQPRLIVHRHLMMVPAALSFGCVHKPGWLTSSFHVFVHSFVTADRKYSICIPFGWLSEIREAPQAIYFHVGCKAFPTFCGLITCISRVQAVWRGGNTW